MSQSVVTDSVASMFVALKPFPNFEEVYQGQPGTVPIAFPGTLDQFAGKPGFDGQLIAGATIPLGSRLTIWIPQTIEDGTATEQPPIVNPLYQYQILWRLRTVRDYRAGQLEGQTTPVQSFSSYHLRSNAFGQPQAVTPGDNAALRRYYLPGSMQTLATVLEPPSGGGPNVVTLRGQVLRPVSDPIWVQPLTPSGNAAVWQQGAFVNSAEANTGGPAYLTYTTEALGDEFCIIASKIDTDVPWDFTTPSPGDMAFSNTFGNNNGKTTALPSGAILFTTGNG